MNKDSVQRRRAAYSVLSLEVSITTVGGSLARLHQIFIKRHGKQVHYTSTILNFFLTRY